MLKYRHGSDAYGKYGSDNGGRYGENAGGGNSAYYNRGQEGHSKTECTVPRKMGACFNCGQEGHSKAECPNLRVFKGTCRICEKEGHPAVDCPERPPDVCKNCQAQGHKTMECKENRKFDLNLVADMLPHEAWAAMKKASDERDLDDFREALKIYSKAVPHATWGDIERKMREDKFNIYIIAMEAEVDDVMSLIDLQGVLDRKFVIGFFFSPKASRGHLRDRWPADAEENVQRMNNAGIPYERKVPKCLNCGGLGHISRSCKEERADGNERVEIKCSNCDGLGHRLVILPKIAPTVLIVALAPAAIVDPKITLLATVISLVTFRPLPAITAKRLDTTLEIAIGRKTGRRCNAKTVERVVGHTVVRCRQPSKDEKPQDETAFSPGSPMREEPDLLGPEASEDPFEFKRHDDNNDLW
ncbi:Zinc knuckle transcription factor (CnjB), putative [Penicillium digitatum PHI26]|uniref:Zinc knuckle transcription factor (CnjB), putative n=2 Tax=Penicillium digitatum TaxID=36651 RepID=K9FG22_PEND2|nr:Zinc knuckle transcription factor (CnjB), putative [Penicillium digitatum Pd1]EKV07127.1 Zinc knuckle transcription factor (CnjB), putative [Penicillium digitatum PHI26]EKV14272.1 Zinc knuckle transcription factor (CnjB), putative [Penicillium digitatum Pd1]